MRSSTLRESTPVAMGILGRILGLSLGVGLFGIGLFGIGLLSTGCSLVVDFDRSKLDGSVGPIDAGTEDAGTEDAGTEDAGMEDAGMEDAGMEDAGTEDAGMEDAGMEDAGMEDAGMEDAGMEDAGVDPCEGNTCDDMDTPCEDFSCDPSDGSCVGAPTAAATACEGMDSACEDFSCDPTDGSCDSVPTAAGAACDAMDTDCADYICAPASGSCSMTTINEGLSCGGGCNAGATCTSGTCAGGSPRPDRFPCDLDSDPCTADQCLSSACVAGGALAGILQAVTVDRGGDTADDRVRINNPNPGGTFNWVTRGLYLCSAQGTCASLNGSFSAAFQDSTALDLDRLAGEVALSASSDGTAVCDYLRWDDDPPVDPGTEGASYTLADDAGPGWATDADVVDGSGLSDTMGFVRGGARGNDPSSWSVGASPF